MSDLTKTPVRLSRPTLLLGLIGLALAGAASLWFVLPAAWSDASTLSARTTVNEWRLGIRPALSIALWESTRDQLQAALGTTPGNAQLYEDLGFVHAARSQGLGRVLLGSTDHTLQRTLMEQAAVHFRAAAGLRPTFPYSWTYLALSKHYLDQHDDEFWAAYDHALHYGRNEAALQNAIADMAFGLWPQLGPQRQQTIALMIAAAKETSRKSLQDRAKNAGIKFPTPQ